MKKTKIAEGFGEATVELLERELRLKGNFKGSWDNEFAPIFDNIDKEGFVRDMIDSVNYHNENSYRYSYYSDEYYSYEYDYSNNILYLLEEE